MVVSSAGFQGGCRVFRIPKHCFLTTLFDKVCALDFNAGIPSPSRAAMSPNFLVCDVRLDRPSHASVLSEQGRFAEFARLLHQQASLFHLNMDRQVEPMAERKLMARDGVPIGTLAIHEAPILPARTARVAVEFCQGEMTYERLASILDGYAMRVAGGIDVPWAGCPARSVITMPPGGFSVFRQFGKAGELSVDMEAAIRDDVLFRLGSGETSVADGCKVYAVVLAGDPSVSSNELSVLVVDAKGFAVGGNEPFEHAVLARELSPIGIDELDSILAVCASLRTVRDHELAFCVPPHLAHLRVNAEVVLAGHDLLSDGHYHVLEVETDSGVAFADDDLVRIQSNFGVTGTAPAHMLASAQRDFVIELVVEP